MSTFYDSHWNGSLSSKAWYTRKTKADASFMLFSTDEVIGRIYVHESRYSFNTLMVRQNGRHFPDDSFKWIFLNENVSISIKLSLKFVPNDPINNIQALDKIMAWHRPGDKPLSEPTIFYIYASLGLNELNIIQTHQIISRPIFSWGFELLWSNTLSCKLQQEKWRWHSAHGWPLASVLSWWWRYRKWIEFEYDIVFPPLHSETSLTYAIPALKHDKTYN